LLARAFRSPFRPQFPEPFDLDPLVVDACLKLFREKGYRLPDH